MPDAKRRPGAPRRATRPWKHTERDRGYMQRKAAAEARKQEKAA